VVATTFNPFNTDINTVRGQETGYATLNPLNNITEATFADGNLKVTTKNASSHYGTHTSTLSMSSGKHYAEVTVESTQGYPTFGVCDVESAFTDTSWIGGLNPAISYYGNNGKKYVNGGSAATYGSSFGAGNTIGIAVDLDNLTVEFFKDGVSQGVITGLTDDTEYFFGGSEFDAGSGVFLWNYGQKPFKFPPPNGFQPLSLAAVRPEKVIANPTQYVGVTTYKGTGASKTISLNHSPDFVWVKQRGGSSTSHALLDSVRANGSSRLQSNSNNAENDVNQYGGGITAFNSNGFTLGTWTAVNGSNEDFVAWTWKAGGNKNTFNVDDIGYASASAAGLTAGTITPAGASVGTKQGFSIVKFHGNQTAGAKVPHGLSQTPDFTIVKQISGTTESWRVRHSSADSTKTLYLNQTVGDTSNTEYISGADSTTITLSTDLNGINGDNDYIMYAWHNVLGLQKFGSFEGTGVADNFIHTGFRSRIVWIKEVDNSNPWYIYDTARNTFNTIDDILWANSSNSESTIGAGNGTDQNGLHIFSNGFAIPHTLSGTNRSGSTYIFCAWAEAPSIGLYGSQSTAR
jgi:hypothetical protein